MNNTEAFKYIDGRLLELVYTVELDLKDTQIKRINREIEFLNYVRGLCVRAEPLDAAGYAHPVDVKAFDGADKVLTYKCYPCPRCSKWISNNNGHRYCEWCGQAIFFDVEGVGKI